MKLNRANIAGLTSPGQQSEMKSILAGTWPPLKPLPVFKYETEEYRATIDFDKKRGEWVCRKTSLPSNEVQELRGGLREITMALPHGEAEMLIEGPEQPEPEFERETNRRLQAIHDWRETFENGARYFELRGYLSESQRTELDDSLRLSLTARQLQFSPKNVANVFDDLSVAGGRFAALIEFAKRKKANQGLDAQAQGEGAMPQAESAAEDDKDSLEISSPESGEIVNNNHDAGNDDAIVANQEGAGPRTDVDDFPAVTIKDVFPEQQQPPLAERMAHIASQPFEIETLEIEDADSPPLIEPPHEEEHDSPAFTGFAAHARTSRSFAERFEGSSWRFPALKISAFQVNVFALLLLFAVTSFTVGLTVGRGPLPRRLREAPKSLLATDAKPPTLTEEADDATSRTPPAPLASSDDSAGTNRPDDATPSEEKFEESTRGSEDSAEVRFTDDSSRASEFKPSAKPELNPELGGHIQPFVPNVPPRASPKLAHPPKAARSISSAPRSPSPYRLTSTIGPEPRLSRSSTILVTVPAQGSQPFRVSFPEKAIAATSSLAMTSQLSVLVPPEPGATVVHKSARLEAGELVSFAWPRYPVPGNRYGIAETIKVRATIGQLGQVLDVKFLGGSISLLPATTGAIRQWRFRPTLLDKRPVRAQQDVTIEFRPPQYSSQLRTQHPSHN